MKTKINILQIALLTATILLAGCEKPESGNDDYTLPAEYHDMTAARHLKKIISEDVYYYGSNDTVILPDSVVFDWDGDRVISVREYNYEVTGIDHQVYLYNSVTYTCTYENNRIASIHVVETTYWHDSVGNLQNSMWESDTPFSYTGMFLTQMASTKVYYNDSSDVIDMKFYAGGVWNPQFKDAVWQNRNLTSVSMYGLNENTSYTYDNKISVNRCIPRELAIFWYGGVSPFLSRNNMVGIDGNPYYTFEYDGDYPTVCTHTFPEGRNIIHYEYE